MTVKSGHGYITRDWGDGTYTFRLDWGAWKELHEKCDGAGPNEIFERLLHRRWLATDLFEIIRLGLIGGGMSPVDALKKTRSYVQDRPLLESVSVALEIVSASIIGPAEEPKTGEAELAKEPQGEVSPSPGSTATVQ